MSAQDRYRERLLPKWWVWIVALGFVGSLAIAYGAALGTVAGLVVMSLAGGLAVWLLWITAPVVEIDTKELVVGGARLPRRFVGDVEVVDRSRIRELGGPGADARVFTALRPWSARDGLLVRVTDSEDPHPAWLFSSRHPARAAEALAATM
jgi:hypothetical protein